MMTPSIEYGVRDTDGEIVWTDEDGELYLGGRWLDAVDVSDERALLTAARNAGKVLVKRTMTVSEPEVVVDPLPTTVGSVVKADGRLWALSEEGTWLLLSREGWLLSYVTTAEQLAGAATVFDAKGVAL